MSVVQFRTPGLIPLEAFDTMGISAKVGDHPIGRFGTGLKYAVAVILREGGTIRLFRDGTEYEFYLSKMDFRGKEFQRVKMRRKNGLGKWLTGRTMPFTTQLGRDWKLWQAYRELESNTRDEGGTTSVFYPADDNIFRSLEEQMEDGRGVGTTIEVDCPGFSDCVDAEYVFLDTDRLSRVFRSPKVDIYDAPSEYLYYRGIRVYELRYPSLFTYDFGEGVVSLTEDRTIGNLWSVMWDLAHIIQYQVEDESVLDRILSKSDAASFENYELNFSSDGSEIFRHRVRYLGGLGYLGRAGERYSGEYMSPPDPEPSTEIKMYDWQWRRVVEILNDSAEEDAVDLADTIEEAL